MYTQIAKNELKETDHDVSISSLYEKQKQQNTYENMYRVFLFLTVLAYCSSAPFSVSNVPKSTITGQNDLVDLIDTAGGGYSYFKNQNIDVRPSARSSLDISAQDLSAYMQASALKDEPVQKQTFASENNILLNNAFGQQELIPRARFPMQNLLPNPAPIQQSAFGQNDFPQLPPAIPNKYANQQRNFPAQSQLSASNIFGNQQRQDLRGMGSQRQQQLLNSFGNQQPQQIWNSIQQQSSGFNPSYGSSGQSPFSSGFLVQSNQQTDQAPIPNARFMSSPPAPQRFNPTNQPFLNNGW